MDAFEKPYWNLIQVLAWVYLRDPDLVRRAADDATGHGLLRRRIKVPGKRAKWANVSRPPPTELELELGAAIRGVAEFNSLDEAEQEILAALGRNTLTASGFENDVGDLKEIAAIQWAILQFYEGPLKGPLKGKSYAGPRAGTGLDRTSWYRLQFNRDEVLKVWPDPSAPIERPRLADEQEPSSEPSERTPKELGAGSADAEEQASLDRRPIPPRRVGRPSIADDIPAAYEQLRDAGKVDYRQPMARLYGPIREAVLAKRDLSPDTGGLGDEVIRKKISVNFRKNKRRQPPQ